MPEESHLSTHPRCWIPLIFLMASRARAQTCSCSCAVVDGVCGVSAPSGISRLAHAPPSRDECCVAPFDTERHVFNEIFSRLPKERAMSVDAVSDILASSRGLHLLHRLA